MPLPPLVPATGGLGGVGGGSKVNLPTPPVPPGGPTGPGGVDLGKPGSHLRADQAIPRVSDQTIAPNQPTVGRPPTTSSGTPLGGAPFGGAPVGATPAGAGGTPPPMMPPMTGAGGGGGGGRAGKPGVGAIRPVNRKRKTQDDDTPGVPVALRGKAGRSLPGSFPMLPTASRRRKDEREKADTIQLLDEELWQVEEAEAAETKKRIGRLAT